MCVPTVGGWKACQLWLELPNWHSLSKCVCVYPCLCFGHSPVGRSELPWGRGHVPILLSSSFHLPSYLSLPLPPLSGVAVSHLISPLLLLTQTLSKQLPRISMHLCARAPFSAKAACVYVQMQAAHQRCSVSFDNNLGPRGVVAPNTLSHSSSSANTGYCCQQSGSAFTDNELCVLKDRRVWTGARFPWGVERCRTSDTSRTAA